MKKETATYTAQHIKQMDKNFRRTFINMLSGFKAAHLMGTVGQEGTFNLAIFNSVMHIGANPPLLGCIFRPLTVPRHSYSNIKKSGFFTFNQVNQQMMHAAHQTSAKYDEGVSEFEACGLTPTVGKLHPAPYVAESHIRIGLRYREEHTIAANDTILLVGEVVEVQIDGSLVGEDGFIDHEQAGTVGVSGLETYYAAKLLERLGYAWPQ